MNNEIKEFIEFRTDEDGTYFYYNDKDNIEQWSYKLDELKDYITNLQEELKSANESISWWQNRFNAVEKENKKLKEEIERQSKAQVILDNQIAEMYDYKTRNEKATEYIKEHRRADLVFKLYLTEQETDNVLNILQGGDK